MELPGIRQGLNVLSHKKNIKNKFKFEEGMGNMYDKNNTRINTIRDQERDQLMEIEKEYNQILEKYSRLQNEFSKEYYSARNEVQNCIAKCSSNSGRYPSNMKDSFRLRSSCKVGCQLKQPYIIKCKDRWGKGKCDDKMTRNGSKLCLDGNITTVGLNYVEGEEYTIDGVNMKDGCCDCGGGSGGRATVKVGDSIVRNCDHYKNVEEKNACKSSPYEPTLNGSAIDTSLLKNKYSNLVNENEKLIKKAEELYERAKTFKESSTNIKSNLAFKRKQLMDELEKYKTNYDLTNMLGKDPTRRAQLEDMLLKKRSGESSYYIYILLAISLGIITIYQLRR